MNNIIIIWILISLLIGLFLSRRNFKNINVSSLLIVTWETQRGKKFIEKISKTRLWNPIGYLGAIILYILGILTFLLFTLAFFSRVFGGSQPSSTVQEPRNYLVIPGVNDYLPLNEWPAIAIGLLVAIIIHEFGHGIFCRFNNIKVDSLGAIFIALIPAGAFVKPNIDSMDESSIKSRLQMVSAGIMNNFILFIISVLGIIFVSTFLISAIPGGAVNEVYPGSPADNSNIQENTVIISINGEEVRTTEEMMSKLESSDETLSLKSFEGQEYTIQKNVFVSSTAGFLSKGVYINSINGVPINSNKDFREQVTNTEDKVEIITSQGNKDVYIGALGKSEQENIIITEIENNRILSKEDMGSYSGVVNAEFIVDGNKKNGIVNLNDYSFVSGYSGFKIKDVGIVGKNINSYYPNIQGKNGILTTSAATLVGPFIPVDGVQFSGFISNQAFFTSEVPIIPKYIIMLIGSILFWSAFLNINLMILNSIPTAPLDGGHSVRYTFEYLSRVVTKKEDLQEKIGIIFQLIFTIIIGICFISLLII